HFNQRTPLNCKTKFRGDYTKCPVYIDFGCEYLVKLDTYDESELKCIRLVSKRKFLHDVMVEDDVQNIATRFYPVLSSESEQKNG
ncbi:hypothetical protein, partial [Yersinia ruckeri]|uniref:hypothetical protein n=1 Tax=Yersinia ruckeri TaxID=29486 RepID=UPI001E5D39F9